MNECIGHVIGKPHSPITGLYFGKKAEKRLSWDEHIVPIRQPFKMLWRLRTFRKMTMKVTGMRCIHIELHSSFSEFNKKIKM